MTSSFHLSLVVPNLDDARRFYVEALGCETGRDAGDWFDVHFFGHQLTLHQERDGLTARAIDHFGPILSKADWSSLAARIADKGIEFQVDPRITDEDTVSEAGKFLVKDPANNVLEFKFRNRQGAQT
jgi:uncharacterized protein